MTTDTPHQAAKDFATCSSDTLAYLDQTLGDLEHEQLDVDLGGDVLILAFGDGTEFIINAHSAAMQIWMAAGSTAWHFSWDGACWASKRSDDELMQTVAREVGKKLGIVLKLKGPGAT